MQGRNIEGEIVGREIVIIKSLRRRCDMSKYNALWEYVQKNEKESFRLTFEEIQKIAGIPIDHCFLKIQEGAYGIWLAG